jgi:hypothetical protein
MTVGISGYSCMSGEEDTPRPYQENLTALEIKTIKQSV